MRFWFVLGFCVGPVLGVQALELTILHINDVYHISRGNDPGGLTRVATYAKKLRLENPNVWLTFGGDGLFPSIESLAFKGKQMVDGFNAAHVDYAVLGNHEFDDPDVNVIKKRLKESKFPWLAANIKTKEGKPFPNTHDFIVIEKEGFKIGIFGACLLFDNQIQNLNYEDPVEAASRAIDELKKQNPDLIVGLTHLNFYQDQEIAKRHPEVDLILGGHEHDNRFSHVGGTLIIKSDSEARLNYLVKIKVKREQDGKATKEIMVKAIPLTTDTPEDPDLLEIAQKYKDQLEKELGPDERIGRLRTDLVVEENGILAHHFRETNVCDLIADAYRDVAQTDVALEMAGAIKYEENIPQGRMTHYKMLSLLPQNDKLVTLRLKGATLKLVLNRWLANEGNGGFPCVSGLSVTYDQSRPYGDKVLGLKIGGGNLDQEKIYALATNSWAAESIHKLDDSVQIIPLAKEMLIREALENYIIRQNIIDPRVDGRIKKVVSK